MRTAPQGILFSLSTCLAGAKRQKTTFIALRDKRLGKNTAEFVKTDTLLAVRFARSISRKINRKHGLKA